VDDHGPCVGQGPEEFARLCAEEPLARQAAPAGRWLVVWWRLDATGTRSVRRWCEVELRGPATAAAAGSEVVPGAGTLTVRPLRRRLYAEALRYRQAW